MTTPIQVDLCRSSLTYCLSCSLLIPRDSLRIQIKSFKKPIVHYHLHCYQPATQRPILLERDVALWNVKAEGDVKIVQDWVERWNKKFSVNEKSVPPRFLEKSVSTTRPLSCYRLLIEVFLYLSPADIETKAAFACKHWFHITREDDLWRTKFTLDFPSPPPPSPAPFRAKYILLFQSSCWKCDKFVPLKDISMVCPLHKRPICAGCAQRKECEVMSLDWFGLRKYVGKDIGSKLGVKTFTHENVEKGYISELCEKLVPYAERRRNLLLSLIEGENLTEEVRSYVETFDFNRYYESRHKYVRKETVALAKFCGRDEENEDVRKSVEDFVRSVRNG